jgi:hypothetical protein
MGVGRPRLYNDPEELSTACEEYFLKCIADALRPTVTGLALWLGFADKTTLYEYRDREEFSYSIKTSLTMIENALEQKLENNAVAGIIFALKNMGWKDKTEQEIFGAMPVVWKEEKTYDKPNEAISQTNPSS